MGNFNKSAAESDPKALEEHQKDPPGSFLDLYRCLNVDRVGDDEEIVTQLVTQRVVPDSLRYGVFNGVFRGVAKGIDGDLYYFNFVKDQTFKLVKADSDTKVWEANKLLSKCHLGCDLLKSEPSSVDAEDEEEEADKAVPGAAQAPIDEEQYIREQHGLITDQHPGGTGNSGTPDDPGEGRDWHKSLSDPTDGLSELTMGEQQHWTLPQLVKAYGKAMQTSAPRLHPEPSSLEKKYMVEVLGKSLSDVSQGYRMTPAQTANFRKWKVGGVQSCVSGLSNWLEKNGG